MIGIRAMWPRHRKALLIVSGLFAVYSLAGFFVVPPIAKRSLLRMFDRTLGVDARIERVSTNPYTLRATLEGFRARERTGADLVAFDELTVNLQASSLFRRAFVFKQIRLVAPKITASIGADGRLNLAALAPDAPAEEPPAEAGELPRLAIGRFELEGGRADLADRSLATPFETQLGPVSLVLHDFSTLPDREGRLAFEATLESSARIRWEGSVAVRPFRSAGHLSVERGTVGLLWRYLQDRLRFRLAEGRYDLALDYDVVLADSGPSATVRDGTLAMRDLVFEPLDQDIEVLRIPELDFTGIGLEWPARRLSVESLRLGKPHLTLWREPDGTIVHTRMAELEARGAAAPAEPATALPVQEQETPSFSVDLERLAIEDLSASFEDRAVEPPFRAEVRALRLESRHVGTEPGRVSPLVLGFDLASGGRVELDGSIVLLPQPVLEGAARVEALSLVPLEPYLAAVARLSLDSAALSFDGRMKSTAEEPLHFRGRAALEDLSCQDTRKGERLVGLGRGRVEDMLLELGRGHLRMAAVELERPYARLTIYEDSTTNVGAVMLEEAAAPPGADSAAVAGPGLEVEIGEVRIRDGAADFADLSLPLPFAAEIAALEGSISELSSGGTSARVRAGGTVDEHGLVTIDGSLDFFAPDRRSDLGVAFRNVEMSRLSPYSRKFVGYAVESGRLSLDLRYRLENRALSSENDIVIEQLTLGEKVDSPDAPNLPVRLAVAMLKDRNGRIDLDIPVSGTLDDPEFSYRKVVWQAIRNVLTKVATAPFLALGKLIGVEGKDLEFVEFAPASDEIAPPAREKLEQLARALGERPEVVLEVRGGFDAEIDRAAIARQKVDADVEARIAALPAAPAGEPRLASEARRSALEALFAERFSADELGQLAFRHTPPADVVAADPAVQAAAAPALDLSAYLEELHSRIAATESVAEAELAALGDARAAAIHGFLASDSGVPDARIEVLPSESLKRGGDNWIRLQLALKDAGGHQEAGGHS